MKLYIIGPGRHGKDTVAGIIHEALGLSFVSSSLFVAEKAVRPYLASLGIEYASLEECYEDRFNHRMAWRKAINDYNSPDLSRMSKELFDAHDIYVGIRHRGEFLAANQLADLSIWVDATRRVKECDPSLDIKPTDCDIRVTNNGTPDALRVKVLDLCADIFLWQKTGEKSLRRVY